MAGIITIYAQGGPRKHPPSPALCNRLLRLPCPGSIPIQSPPSSKACLRKLSPKTKPHTNWEGAKEAVWPIRCLPVSQLPLFLAELKVNTRQTILGIWKLAGKLRDRRSHTLRLYLWINQYGILFYIYLQPIYCESWLDESSNSLFVKSA